MSQYRNRTSRPCTGPVGACTYDCANRAITANPVETNIFILTLI